MRREWTKPEERDLARLSSYGARLCAEWFERSVDALHCKVHEINRQRDDAGLPRISLERTSFSVLDIQDSQLTVEVRRRVEATRAGLVCPACGCEPVTIRTTGLCGACHYKALEEATRARELEVLARRGYNSAKKRKSRLRQCRSCGRLYSPRRASEGRQSDPDLCPRCRT